jgi:hypothetical protein
MRIYQALLPLAAAMIITGCGNRGTAQNVVAQAEGALNNVKDGGGMYAPDKLKTVEGEVAGMKKNFDDGDYKAVVNAVPAFNTHIQELDKIVADKTTASAAATMEWNTLNAEVPKSVEAIQARVDTLGKGKLPKDVTKENLATAKTDLETMKTTWSEATAAAGAGKTLEAAEKGRTVQAKANELKTTLAISDDTQKVASTTQPAGMTPPAGTTASKPAKSPGPASAPAEPDAATAPGSTPAPDATAPASPASTPPPEAAPAPLPEPSTDPAAGSAEPPPPQQ